MENKEVYGRVYLITNKVNGKQYIGQTINTIKWRFNKHGYDKNTVITKAIKKYGRKNFKIEEVDVAYNQKQLDLLEGVYISWFKTLVPNGYNVTNIIDGKGKSSKETKMKMKIIQNHPERLKLSSELGKKTRGKSLGGKSKYCGVYVKKEKYQALIRFNKKGIYLGTYVLETDAAKAYDIKAIELFGHDCNLNFPELRQDYIDNKIKINRLKKKPDSDIIGVGFCNSINKWEYSYNGIKRCFKTKGEAEQFAKDHLDGKITLVKNVRKNSQQSGEKYVLFHKKSNNWCYRWFDKTLQKNKSKDFKTLKEAIAFKYTMILDSNHEKYKNL